MRRSVAITGIGVVCGAGIGADPFWESLLAGRSSIGPIRAFDASAFPIRFAAEVDSSFQIRDFVPKTYRKATKVMCRDIELAVAAAAKAVDDARLVTKASASTSSSDLLSNGNGTSSPSSSVPTTYPPQRMGCQIGAGVIVAEVNELTAAFAKARDPDGSFSLRRWGSTGMNELTPLWLLKYLPNMLACHVTILHDCRGPSNTITCAETSGALSVGESMRVIERGDADVCFSGGAESKINLLGLVRQWHTEMMAPTDADTDPARLVQPFGTKARGSAPGEGAAILIVEALDAALARGARIYAEITGFGAGQSPDLQDQVLRPHPSGRGMRAAVDRALQDAGIDSAAIDAIVPAGIGAPAYDRAESAALRDVFGSRLASIPLITTKPNIGLCAAAASAIDLAAGALAIHHQSLPARINGDSVIAGLDAATTPARDARLRSILVTGMGLGGQNTAVILKRHSS